VFEATAEGDATLGNISCGQCRPDQLATMSRRNTHSAMGLTSLLTSKRNKFCSCSGCERSNAAINDRDCARTYERGSEENVCSGNFLLAPHAMGRHTSRRLASRICTIEKKYFFNQSSKNHMSKWVSDTEWCSRAWSRKCLECRRSAVIPRDWQARRTSVFYSDLLRRPTSLQRIVTLLSSLLGPLCHDPFLPLPSACPVPLRCEPDCFEREASRH
jgi:hypothetical protein